MPDFANGIVCPLRPLAGRVVVRRLDGPFVTPGGIVLPGPTGKAIAKRKHHEGVVAAVGPGKRLKDGGFAPAGLAVGARVVYTTLGGQQEFFRDGVCWLILNQHDVQVTVEGVPE